MDRTVAQVSSTITNTAKPRSKATMLQRRQAAMPANSRVPKSRAVPADNNKAARVLNNKEHAYSNPAGLAEPAASMVAPANAADAVVAVPRGLAADEAGAAPLALPVNNPNQKDACSATQPPNTSANNRSATRTPPTTNSSRTRKSATGLSTGSFSTSAPRAELQTIRTTARTNRALMCFHPRKATSPATSK